MSSEAASASPAPRPTPAQLAGFAPLSALSPERLAELAAVAVLERVERGADPVAPHRGRSQALFLLRGELLLYFAGGGTQVIVGATGEGRYPLLRRDRAVDRSRAISDVELLVLDQDALDILVTFDQVAAGDAAARTVMGRAVRSDARLGPGIFSLTSLRHGAFSRLPPARLEELLARFERVAVARGEEVVREGDPGEFYFVIESGRCEVTRTVGGVKVALAELRSGDGFGEEALASDARRNATVTMSLDGWLLRLGKADFQALLAEPLLQRVGFEEAKRRVAGGAVWLDVRYPSEYRFDRLPGAMNVPLNEIRNSFPVLDPGRDYILYCQSGRRSSAAAFLLAQRGFRASVLQGGLWATQPGKGG